MLVDETSSESASPELTEAQIVDQIFDAVIDQRLPPGAKLSESALCEAFGVGRMRIRRSLLLLASREVVDLRSNRGAFVSSPTAEQAREIFESRLMIEPNVAVLAAERANETDLAMLRAHLEKEHQAHRSDNRHEAIRLSGQFHVVLASIAANSVMERMIKELVTRTSLIIGIFGAPGTANCRDDDHSLILEALRTGNGEAASRLMTEHLGHIQANLDLSRGRKNNVDLVRLFGDQR
ncbi:DNA-binding GntR family transcriptional regulator [Hoeflea marina]|uniref:DNA-binding GntR family transcriptional regulator n=1 Tax=Hoeflea marina TaxID=274592 RepID=A0A317PFS8_9HYPH|nr:GntR family transcriptional regulator [Hoeflea marina]PWV99061.1 DNA-binding GntR family transcriptional regulator [Hoeflea marina]